MVRKRPKTHLLNRFVAELESILQSCVKIDSTARFTLKASTKVRTQQQKEARVAIPALLLVSFSFLSHSSFSSLFFFFFIKALTGRGLKGIFFFTINLISGPPIKKFGGIHLSKNLGIFIIKKIYF